MKPSKWSEEDHKNFLTGLFELGRGRWREISKEYVLTKTPTQVASHAQKFFARLYDRSITKRKSQFDMPEYEKKTLMERLRVLEYTPYEETDSGVSATSQAISRHAQSTSNSTSATSTLHTKMLKQQEVEWLRVAYLQHCHVYRMMQMNAAASSILKPKPVRLSQLSKLEARKRMQNF